MTESAYLLNEHFEGVTAIRDRACRREQIRRRAVAPDGVISTMTPAQSPRDAHRAIDAIWRIESARLIAGLARFSGDLGRAEELAQDALVAALEKWPEDGVPANPGAWLMTTAKNRAIDLARRDANLAAKTEQLGRDPHRADTAPSAESEASLDGAIDDDLLSLVFTTCHPMLSPEARVALTLRLLGGLTTAEIARAYMDSEPTVAAAHHSRQEETRRRRRGIRDSGRRRTRLPAAERAGSDLPDLQRGLLGHGRRAVDSRRPLRRGDAPRPHPR